jgi:hypothetical protein
LGAGEVALFPTKTIIEKLMDYREISNPPGMDLSWS